MRTIRSIGRWSLTIHARVPARTANSEQDRFGMSVTAAAGHCAALGTLAPQRRHRRHVRMTASQSVYRDMAISEWTKVVSNPLGLAGFALFLVFAYLAKVKSADERRWLSPAAVLVALAALLGGLLIAYAQIPKTGAASSNEWSVTV